MDTYMQTYTDTVLMTGSSTMYGSKLIDQGRGRLKRKSLVLRNFYLELIHTINPPVGFPFLVSSTPYRMRKEKIKYCDCGKQYCRSTKLRYISSESMGRRLFLLVRMGHNYDILCRLCSGEEREEDWDAYGKTPYDLLLWNSTDWILEVCWCSTMWIYLVWNWRRLMQWSKDTWMKFNYCLWTL